MSDPKESYISRYQARVQHKISASRLKAGIESGQIRAIWRGTRLCDVSAADVIRVMKTPHNQNAGV